MFITDNNKDSKIQSDKLLLSLEIFIGISAVINFYFMIFFVCYVQMPNWIKIILIVLTAALFIIGIAYSIKIEQTAGYYECAKCKHWYVPTYKSVFMASHMGRTRYMRCPNCHEKSWQKKRISK